MDGYHKPSEALGEITYGVTVEVWEWTSNFFLHIIMDAITYPCKLNHVDKRGPILLIITVTVCSVNYGNLWSIMVIWWSEYTTDNPMVLCEICQWNHKTLYICYRGAICL